MRRLAVFASGTGTNYEAIQRACEAGEINAAIELVVVDKAHAKVIDKALSKGIEVFVFDPKAYENKKAYETVILEKLREKDIEFIALAGYMRLFGEVLLNAYEGRIVNIHPSLLPAFKGKDAIGQAIAYGVKVMGVTIHYVDAGMDTGRIIAQQSFDVADDMSHDDIEANIHAIEHVLYPKTLKKLLEELK